METRSGLSDSSYDDTAKPITPLGISGFYFTQDELLIKKVIKEFCRSLLAFLVKSSLKK